MITEFWLVDWALISVSLFNALLLIWLGLTIMLNAERRDWAVRLVAAGFLSGALFFVCHTVIVGHELTIFGSEDLEGWWRAGWYPVILAPLSWYLVALWYGGFWEGDPTHLRRWHRPMVWLLIAYTLLLAGLLTFAHPLPTYLNLTLLKFSGTTAFMGVPLLLLLYPPFAWLCIVLSLDALRHPIPSQRMMGDLARGRARPWLMAAAVALLLVVTAVAVFILWLLSHIPYQPRTGYEEPTMTAVQSVAYVDLLLDSLIGVAIFFLGQAIVSYEIFTGQTLPRRGFFRQWRGTVLFAWGTAWIVGFALNWQVLPIFSFLLATVVMMVLYAFFGWRTFRHREELIARLRPFVIGQAGGVPGITQLDQQARVLFTAICDDVLDTTRAYLIPLGTRVPLASAPLTHPPDLAPPTFRLMPDLFLTPDTIIVPLAGDYAGAVWGIPLWTGRGLIGALLLGPKRGHAVYTREEIEIARASAERILDALTGEQIAQRLVQIQRRRLAETRVLDLRTRRTLHDNILPELHMIALHLSGLGNGDPVIEESIQSLARIHHEVSDLIHTPGGTFAANGQNGQFGQALRTLIDEEFDDVFEAVTWHTPPTPPKLDDPLLYEIAYNAVREVVRNAALHGRGDQPARALHLIIDIRHEASALVIEVCDDGVGMAYLPQHAATAGSGGGLMLHSTMLAISGGELRIDSPPVGGGTRVTISVPD